MRITADFEINPRALEEFARVMVPEAKEAEVEITSELRPEEIVLKLVADGREATLIYPNLPEIVEEQRMTMAKLALLVAFEKRYPWGGLMGVRPTKVVRKMQILGLGREEIFSHLTQLYLVSPEKANLLLDVVEREQKFMTREFANIYIGVPFCPSKCRYCSFASHEIGSKLGKFYPEFVETLLEEIKLTGELIASEELKIGSIYIGGGTPSTLTEEDLLRVLQAVREHIDFSFVKEFTFEAGREDSLTLKKLEIMKEFGVDRISLNPQTFNEETLHRMNRKFDRERFDLFYGKVRELGFILNMDLILGLPGEGVEEILHTLEELKGYEMENLTIHSLALKKASDLFKDTPNPTFLEREIIEKRIEELLREKNLKPYYLYRQKNSLDWGENVGYAKEGYESIFNIEMIEENQSTLALGGGAITKLVEAEDALHDRIERIINPKDPSMYIREMRERFEQKRELFRRR